MQLSFKRGPRPTKQGGKAVSEHKFKVALHQLPEITDFMTHDDLTSFVTAIKPLGLELKDPWARRFAAKVTMPLPVLKGLQINYEIQSVFDDRIEYQPVDFKALCLNLEKAMIRGPAVVSEQFTIRGQWSTPIWPNRPVHLDVSKVVPFAAPEIKVLRDAAAEISKLHPESGRLAKAMVDRLIRLQNEWQEASSFIPSIFCPESQSGRKKYLSHFLIYNVDTIDVDMFHFARYGLGDVARRYEAHVDSFKNFIFQFGAHKSA